ncbi:SagB/ThcOx family dehydrogenase [Pelagibius marinus]|uniref:SagB/ThcOx family dehydrogenase n=1 Tax=Pelagibius marinus TaxID=2762760 RepID=UPI0018726D14|nr:SagB/ThcOx family dehydrogenase [Pelagibius marinus]
MTSDLSLQEALAARRSNRDFTGRAVPLESLQRLVGAAQGVTGAEGQRTAPSAHALYPLGLRLVAGEVEGLEAGLYEVEAEQAPRLLKAGDLRPALQEAALEEQPWVGGAAAILAICADMEAVRQHFAEQPPLGERGSRYVYIEAGAAAQNALLQVAADGLGGVLVAGFDDQATAEVLGLEAPFAPLLYLCLGWPTQAE